MSRLQWKLFAIFMTTLFLPFPFIPRYPMVGLVSAASFVLVFASTFGWMAVRAIRDVFIRRRGTPVFGTVIHARSSGYENNIPNWEIDVRLPDGTMGSLMVVRFTPFSPNERIKLIVDSANPTHPVLAPQPSPDF